MGAGGSTEGKTFLGVSGMGWEGKDRDVYIQQITISRQTGTSQSIKVLD